MKAVQKLQSFYFHRKIDMFKVAMSVPGLAKQMLFKSGKESGAVFPIIGNDDVDLHQTIKNNVIGGPSIIFNRRAKAGETYVRNKSLSKESLDLIVTAFICMIWINCCLLDRMYAVD